MRVSRFAPSPTGLLHLGHAYSAFQTLDAASGERFLLRIEDIDRTRCKPEFEDAIYEDLRWLGLDWETPVRRQSDHIAAYESALTHLRERNLVYRCFRTRKDILAAIESAPHEMGEVFVGARLSKDEEHDRLARGEAFAWRLSLARCRDELGAVFDALSFMECGEGPNGETGRIAARPDLLGDVVLGRKDFPASYHLAACHDDAAQGVTVIARGQDLFPVTHLHVLLQRLFGWPTPDYRHHRLICGPDGKRYAKRDRSVTLRALRAAGKTRSEVLAMAQVAR
jgi:glutamyl-Q tRNA(Asp) synthetase